MDLALTLAEAGIPVSFYPMPILGATGLGVFLGHRVRHLSESLTEPFGVLQAALLGVVGLLLAFGLSLAVSRYEDRRSNIVTEANAIGTEYLRAELLPAGDAARVRTLLRDYVDQRMLFYSTRDPVELEQVNARTAALQADMWSAV